MRAGEVASGRQAYRRTSGQRPYMSLSHPTLIPWWAAGYLSSGSPALRELSVVAAAATDV